MVADNDTITPDWKIPNRGPNPNLPSKELITQLKMLLENYNIKKWNS